MFELSLTPLIIVQRSTVTMPLTLNTQIHRATLALYLSLIIAPPAFAGFEPPECTCQNLGSLQQGYRNAITIESRLERKAKHLEAFETRERVNLPNDPEGVESRVLAEGSRYDDVHGSPWQGLTPVEGDYGGEMTPGKCTPDKDAKEGLRMQIESPCLAMAKAALNHARFHRENCTRMGPDAYWNQSHVDFTREQAEAYGAQADELREEIRRVLEEADVTYKADSRFDLNVQGMAQYAYESSARSDDIGQPSDGDTWTMIGRGTGTGKWVKAVIAGMRCKPSGAIKSNFEVRLRTDGLTFDLEIGELVTSGDVSISCRGARGGSGPVGEVLQAPGMITSGQPLQAGDNPLPGNMTDKVRAQLSSVGTVTFKGESVLSVSCSAP